jgi:hypothetical protein
VIQFVENLNYKHVGNIAGKGIYAYVGDSTGTLQGLVTVDIDTMKKSRVIFFSDLDHITNLMSTMKPE